MTTTLANGQPVYTATVTIGPNPHQSAYQCVAVVAINNWFWAYDLQYSASSQGTCLS